MSLTQIIELRKEKHFKRLSRNQWLFQNVALLTGKGRNRSFQFYDCIILNSTHYSDTQTSYVSLWFNLKLFRDPLGSTRRSQQTCVHAVILSDTTLLRLWWTKQENEQLFSLTSDACSNFFVVFWPSRLYQHFQLIPSSRSRSLSLFGFWQGYALKKIFRGNKTYWRKKTFLPMGKICPSLIWKFHPWPFC